MRIHRPVSLLLIVFCILHISFVIPVLRNRNVLVNVSGVLAVVFMIVLIFSCHVLKQKDRRMKWHRILTILMTVCIVWHVVVYFKDFREYQRNVESIVFENIELSDVEDGTFVSNTGRKAKNTQDVMIFSKGKARNMRYDKKKSDITGTDCYMSGCNGML